MTVQSWLESFAETIDGAAFRHAAAGALAGFMIRYGAPVGSFVEGRRGGDRELFALDVADRVLVIENGEIVDDSPRSEVDEERIAKYLSV